MTEQRQHGNAAGDLTRLQNQLLAWLPDVLGDVRALLAEREPDMATFLDEAQEEVLAGTANALRYLAELALDTVDRSDRTDASSSIDGDVQSVLFTEIGRMHWRRGADLASLLSIYQSGARVAWRRLSRNLLQEGGAPETLAALADALLFLVDQISSASARGYTAEQSEGAVSRARLRSELVDVILSGSPDVTALQAAAARAGWRIPRLACLVIVLEDTESARSVLDRLDVDVLPVRRDGRIGAIVPNPDAPGRKERLAQHLAGLGAIVGFPVELRMLPESAVIAATATQLVRTGVLTDDPVFVEDHLDAVIVHRDAPLLDALRRQVLAPLDRAPRISRDRLAETLAAWLRHMGDRQAVARELNIHPQTVRYRLGVLHDLFGDALDDPASRSRITLALGWTPTESSH